MRQVLLTRIDPVRTTPVLVWMDDSTRLGDELNGQGTCWVVSAIYGTHFSEAGGVARRDRPPRHWDNAYGGGAPIER